MSVLSSKSNVPDVAVLAVPSVFPVLAVLSLNGLLLL